MFFVFACANICEFIYEFALKNWLANLLLLLLLLFLYKSGSNVAYNDDDNIDNDAGFEVSLGRGFDLRFVFELRFGFVARPVFTFNGARLQQ